MTTETTQQPELFTVIYTDYWAAKMMRCERKHDETVLDMLVRHGIEESAVFIFQGHPKLKGES